MTLWTEHHTKYLAIPARERTCLPLILEQLVAETHVHPTNAPLCDLHCFLLSRLPGTRGISASCGDRTGALQLGERRLVPSSKRGSSLSPRISPDDLG